MGAEYIPPLGKDGHPILIPELIEEDFDATTAIFRRFVSDGTPFILEDLRAHLAGNNVQLPADPEELREMFEEMVDVTLTYYADRREARTWHQQKVGREVVYTLVEIIPHNAIDTLELPAEQETAETEPAGALPLPADAGSSSPTHSQDHRPLLAGETLAAIFGAQDLVRLKHAIGLVASTMGIDTRTAADLIANTRDAGGLFKHTIGGVTFIGREPPERLARAETEPTDAEVARLLNEDEIGIMVRVMDRLTTGGRHVSQGETIKALRQALDMGSGPAFNRLLRIMEDQRLIKFDSTANYGRARKSPRVHVRGQDMKERWIGNREAYINRLRKVTIPV